MNFNQPGSPDDDHLADQENDAQNLSVSIVLLVKRIAERMAAEARVNRWPSARKKTVQKYSTRREPPNKGADEKI